MDVKELIGMRIKHLRKTRGLSQEQLAEKVGLSAKYLSSIERGKENPTLDIFIKLAGSLKVDIAEVFNIEPRKTPAEARKTIADLLKSGDDEKLSLALKILKSLYL